MNAALVAVLTEALAAHPGDVVFLSAKGRPYSERGRGVLKAFQLWAREARIVDFRFHDLPRLRGAPSPPADLRSGAAVHLPFGRMGLGKVRQHSARTRMAV